MSSLTLLWLLLAFSFGACLFAFIKGGSAERLGASVVLGNLLISMGLETALQQPDLQIAQLVVDALTALTMLTLLLRYASIWLGLVMLLYAGQFALHAFYLVMELPRDMLHFAANNLCFLGVNLALIVGTLMNRRARLAQAA